MRVIAFSDTACKIKIQVSKKKRKTYINIKGESHCVLRHRPSVCIYTRMHTHKHAYVCLLTNTHILCTSNVSAHRLDAFERLDVLEQAAQPLHLLLRGAQRQGQRRHAAARLHCTRELARTRCRARARGGGSLCASSREFVGV